MLLWPSYQAEVIFATPPKRGAASPQWLKSLLSPRPKWQMWFYLYILNRVCGGVLRILSEALHGFSRYLLISGIVSIFFLHWVNHLNLCSLSPVTADCGWCKLPNCYDTCHIAFGTEGCIHYIPALSQSKRTFTNVSLWKFRCWSAVYALQKSLLRSCTTVQLYRKPFQMYLFWTINKSKIHANWFHLASECVTLIQCCTFLLLQTISITFTNCLQSDILKAVAPKVGKLHTLQHTSWSLYFDNVSR